MELSASTENQKPAGDGRRTRLQALERAAAEDSDVGVRGEFGGADHAFDVERLFLELMMRNHVDIDVADDPLHFGEELGAIFLDFGGDGDGLDDQFLGDGPEDVEKARDAGDERQVDDMRVPTATGIRRRR